MNTIPYVIEKTAAGERSYDIFSRLLKDRIIMIGSEFNDDLANRVTAQLLFCQPKTMKKTFRSISTARADQLPRDMRFWIRWTM